MKTEKTQDNKLEEITSKLEKGISDLFESERYANYLKTMSKLHNYSFNNTLLIALQKPDATMVAGYTSWKAAFHRNVMKGEKGIKILAPSPYKIDKVVDKIDPDTNKPIKGKDGQVLKERIQVTIPAFKVTTVFDISQTEGEPIPEISSVLKDDVKNFNRLFKAIQQVSPVDIKLKQINNGAKGFYHQEEKYIAIQAGMSEAQTIKTAIHEVSHSLLHDKDSGSEKDLKLGIRTKEVQAESVAFTVCSHFGLDTSDYSFGYIAGWSSDKETQELKESMELIKETASQLISNIEEKLYLIEADEKIDVLADDVNEFVKSYDPYEYADAVDDEAAFVEEIKSSIEHREVEHIQSWLVPILKEDDSQELKGEAKQLMERLDEYSNIKAAQLLDEETLLENAEEMTNMVQHHRSH